MTGIDHHALIGDSNCTNSTTATVKCACAAAAVVVSVGLQINRRLEHIAIRSLFIAKTFVVFANISSIKSTISLQEITVFPPSFVSGIRIVIAINLRFFISSSNIVFIQSLFSHSLTVCVVIFVPRKPFKASLALP